MHKNADIIIKIYNIVIIIIGMYMKKIFFVCYVCVCCHSMFYLAFFLINNGNLPTRFYSAKLCLNLKNDTCYFSNKFCNNF